MKFGNQLFSMQKKSSLQFNEFSEISEEQWNEKISKEIKGSSIEDISTRIDTISILPFYTNSINESEKFFQTKNESNHTVLLREKFSDFHTDNSIEKINTAIEGGIKSIILSGSCNQVKLAAQKLPEQNIQLSFDITDNVQLFLTSTPFIFSDKISYLLEHDPISQFAQSGRWLVSKKDDFVALENTFEYIREHNLPIQKSVHVNASIYHNAGAGFIQELSFSLAHAHEYIVYLLEHGFKIEEIISKIQFTFSVGTDYFAEIAKLRAFQILWANLIRAYHHKIDACPCYIHAETSRRYHTVKDEHTNILRTTTQAMSALIGGCNTLSILPFNSLKNADEFSRRIARNTGNILFHEASFSSYPNIANGSYFIESLTTEFTKKAWLFFKEIEKSGGLVESLSKNEIQDEIKKNREKELQEYKIGKRILMGINKYETLIEQSEAIHYTPSITTDTNAKSFKECRIAELIERDEKK
ncbi:MAG: Methylmalonyl-CoA mutase small subunit [Flavobacteriales bacterium]|nr:Methylmalonyl-CoA mutase small subunit [Flavobacteriales bacterium]